MSENNEKRPSPWRPLCFIQNQKILVSVWGLFCLINYLKHWWVERRVDYYFLYCKKFQSFSDHFYLQCLLPQLDLWTCLICSLLMSCSDVLHRQQLVLPHSLCWIKYVQVTGRFHFLSRHSSFFCYYLLIFWKWSVLLILWISQHASLTSHFVRGAGLPQTCYCLNRFLTNKRSAKQNVNEWGGLFVFAEESLCMSENKPPAAGVWLINALWLSGEWKEGSEWYEGFLLGAELQWKDLLRSFVFSFLRWRRSSQSSSGPSREPQAMLSEVTAPSAGLSRDQQPTNHLPHEPWTELLLVHS